jgi:hypothetical protein
MMGRMATTTDKKELWVGWTRDAISQYAIPEEVENTDELVDDMRDVATKYADSMLDEFEERFGGGGRSAGGGRRRRGEPEE